MSKHKDDRYGVYDRQKTKIIERYNLIETDMRVGNVMDRAKELNKEEDLPTKRHRNEDDRRYIPVEEEWMVYREYDDGTVTKGINYKSPEEAEERKENMAEVQNSEIKIKKKIEVL